MSYSIHKYTLQHQNIIPASAKILSFELQNDTIVFWALVPLVLGDAERTVEFQVFGTGWSISDEQVLTHKHKATLQDSQGMVWHVFQRKDK